MFGDLEDPEKTARRLAALLGVDYHIETQETRPAPSVTATATTAVVELPDGYEDVRVGDHGVNL